MGKEIQNSFPNKFVNFLGMFPLGGNRNRSVRKKKDFDVDVDEEVSFWKRGRINEERVRVKWTICVRGVFGGSGWAKLSIVI